MKQLIKMLPLLGLMLIINPIYVYAQIRKPLVLTLKDAVLLSMRNNPDVISGELDRITQKYSLIVEKSAFEPIYTLTGDAYYSPDDNPVNNGRNKFEDATSGDLNPTVSLKTHYGTTFTLSGFNSASGSDGYSPSLSLQVMQPLLQGFGKSVVMASLRTAIDTEQINKLTLKETVITTITTVINDYMQVMQSKYQLQNDQAALRDYEKTVIKDKKLIVAGRLARTEVVQTEAQVATQKSTIQNDMNTIHQNRLQLLKDLGLDPGADIIIPNTIDFNSLMNLLTVKGSKTKLPALATAKNMALNTDPSYQTEGISLDSLRRDLLTAKDQQRWELNLTASEALGGNFTRAHDISHNGLETNAVNNSYVGLELTIPIHDLGKKQAVIDARIALEKAYIQYQQQKRDIEKNAEDHLHTAISNHEQLRFSKNALKLQRKNMEYARRKYNVGLISTFELIKDQQDLNSAQESVLTEQIDFINALVTLNQTIGTTLDNWGVKVKY